MELEKYYHTENDDENPFICSQPRENGMRDCSSVPKLYDEADLQCNLDMYSYNSTDNTTCVNWNQYYSNCSAGLVNPFKGAINFDNICYAWIAIFQVRAKSGKYELSEFQTRHQSNGVREADEMETKRRSKKGRPIVL